jgi:predicted O-methyltransferase YrrM
MIDNSLWHGFVVDPDKRDDVDVKGISETIKRAKSDERVVMHTIKVSDGFTVVYKK